MLEHDMYKSESRPEATRAVSTATLHFQEMNNGQTLHVKNQLGEFEFQKSQILQFNSGIVGFQELKEFALANLPYENMEQFKLLQSIEVPELSFIVLPTAPEGGILEPQDVEEIMTHFGIPKPNLAFLFIVTIRHLDGQVKITMNARAPIILDTASKTGRQYILPNQKYSIQQEL